MEWTSLFNPQCSVQVIHLLRDPRALIRSRLVGRLLNKRKPERVCTEMEQDLQLANILPADRWDHSICKGGNRGDRVKSANFFRNKKSALVVFFILIRYIRIKYEHLAEDPSKTLEMLYKFSGVQITSNIYKALWQMTHGRRQDLKNISFCWVTVVLAAMASMVLNVGRRSIQITGNLRRQ